MSSVMRPAGKLPARVYWRRRLVVLTVLVLLVWLVTRLVGGGDGDPSSAAPPAPAPTSAAPTTPATSSPAPPPKDRKAKDVQVDVRFAPVGAACPPETVSVTPAVPSGSYAGRAVALTLRVSSTSDQPCRVRIDPSTVVLNVSGSDGTVWDTHTCDTLPARTVDVHPTWATVVEVTWDGRAHGDSCDERGDLVKQGTYTAHAALLGGEPASSSFTLAAPPTPTPKPTPSPSSGRPSASPATATERPAKPTPKPGRTPATTTRTP